MMGAECDRIVPSGVVRQTAARYRHGTSVEIPRSDHMVFSGAALPVTMATLTTGLLGITCSPLPSCPADTARGVSRKILRARQAVVHRASPNTFSASGVINFAKSTLAGIWEPTANCLVNAVLLRRVVRWT